MQKDFFKPTFLPKNKWTNSTLLLVDLFSFIVWKKVKTPKRHFEIIWHLQNFSFNIKQATDDHEIIWEWCRSFVTGTSQPDQPKYVGYILMHSFNWRQSIFHNFWICRGIIQIKIRLQKCFNSIVVIVSKEV